MKLKKTAQVSSPSAKRPAGPDWRKVAKERLRKLTELEQQCEHLRKSLAEELFRALTEQMNTHCIERRAYETKLRAISEFVAERVRPKLYGR